jgi:hypothetical protein
MARTWILLTYKLPSEPSASRVGIWRKLKRLGALLLHDAVWVLPASARNREQFQWLAAEVHELGGDALLWQADALQPAQEDRLYQQFFAQVEPAYLEILAALDQPDRDVAALARRYQQVLQQDQCASPLGAQVRAALLAAREGDER